jgi:A/G-specific adenine glycosylase
MESKDVTAFQGAVLTWYKTNGRQLPWRQTTDPYQILVSEIMLQQTQVDRVLIKYKEWLEQFPTAQLLANAPTGDIIRAWAGLGYNRRAIYLQEAARQWPTTITEENLLLLPGIGPYTAAAVMAFAFNTDTALVDTNIKRIYQLLVFGDQDEPSDKKVRQIAEQFLPTGHSRDWHNALMDIGTIIGKERGAKAQQAKLVELFPILKDLNLPKVTDQPLKRPKQTDFKTSRRYWRGRIIDWLRVHHRGTVEQLEKQFNESPYRIAEIIAQLAKDKLLVLANDEVYLP